MSSQTPVQSLRAMPESGLLDIYTPSHFALIEVTGDPTDASSPGINVSLYAVHISP